VPLDFCLKLREAVIHERPAWALSRPMALSKRAITYWIPVLSGVTPATPKRQSVKI
jgi:hypothetical protein